MAAGGCHPICHDLLPAGCVLSLWCVQRGGAARDEKKRGKMLNASTEAGPFLHP